jgi:hypothetical protein
LEDAMLGDESPSPPDTLRSALTRLLSVRKLSALSYASAAIVAISLLAWRHGWVTGELRSTAEIVIVIGTLTLILQGLSSLRDIASSIPGLTMSARIQRLPPLMRAIADHHCERLQSTLDDMERDRFRQNVAISHEDLSVTFVSILNSANTYFKAVSIDRFWTRGNMGGKALPGYSSANFEFARRGGSIVRYLVVDDTKSLSPWVRRAVADMLTVEERLRREGGAGSMQLYLIPRTMLPDSGEWRERNFAVWDDSSGEDWLVDMLHNESEDKMRVFRSLEIRKGR